MGGLYGLLGVGLSIQWGVMKIANVALPAFTFLAAYVAFWSKHLYDFDPFFSIIIVIPISFVIGLAIYFFLHVTKVKPLQMLLVAFGFLLIFEGGMTAAWTGDMRAISTVYSEVAYQLGTFNIPLVRLLAFVVGVGILGLIYFLFERTYVGKGIRAIVDNRTVAMMYGINPHRTFPAIFGLATVLASVAGVFVGLTYSFTPQSTFIWLGKILAIVVLAGMGSIKGVFAAGLILALAENITGSILPVAWSDFVSYIILIFVLLIKPMGISGRSYE
jgi:branched-chain amino acid transport system permease protein